MSEGPRIYADDVRRAGFCITPGARDWFARHDLDFRDFIKNGISESEFLNTGDALAQRVVDHKRANGGA